MHCTARFRQIIRLGETSGSFAQHEQTGSTICWADDTWLFATSTSQLNNMVRTLAEAALRMADMDLRLPKCQWTRIQKQGQALPEFRPTHAHSDKLMKMQEMQSGIA